MKYWNRDSGDDGYNGGGEEDEQEAQNIKVKYVLM